MRLSKSFTKTYKEVSDKSTANHELLVKGGFVDQLMAGVYSYLPLGLKVLRKIENIVREEMDNIGGEEILMPTLHPKEPWLQTGGWDSIDVLFKINSRTGHEYALGQSEEEVVTPLVMGRVQSYKDLPAKTYQIHWKYRDELRAKSGIMRGREFYMKDMYSFHADQADFDSFYNEVKEAYLRIFKRLGLQAKVTEASGGDFSDKISYEFMVLTDAGEDNIFFCNKCDFCVNEEIAKVKQGDQCPSCHGARLEQGKASEVGNVFDLGQKYSKDFNLNYSDENNERKFPVMGCYGIGISRVMGVIVEKFNDDSGIIWPKSVAPAQVHLIAIGDEASTEADKLYEQLRSDGVEVIYDDREESAGRKFADADLIGTPKRIIISDKTLKSQSAELKIRTEGEIRVVPLSDLQNELIGNS